MSDSINDFLAGLFSGEPALADNPDPTAGGPATIPEPVAPMAEVVGLSPDVPEPFEFGPDGWPVDTIDQGGPCPACGSLETWWSIDGNEHCQRCEAPGLEKAFRLADRAVRLRRKHPHRQNRAPDVAHGASEAANPTRNTSG